MRKIECYPIQYIIAILPTVFTLFLLVEYFPYTGLERIISIPFTFVINTLILIIGISLTDRLNKIPKATVRFGIILLTILIAVALHPQEFNPNVFEQILDKIRL